MNSSQTNRDLINTLGNLPSLPQIHAKLISVINAEDSTLDDISAVLSTDPALSGQILRLANSAYLGLKQKISSIDRAVSLLGKKVILNNTLTSAVQDVFDRRHKIKAGVMNTFWWHSLKCACTARALARVINYTKREEAFLASLMHDIGKLVLWIHYPAEYACLHDRCNGDLQQLLEGERQIVAGHDEIGACLLKSWQIDSFMIDAVRYHHESRDNIAASSTMVKLLFVANQLSMENVDSLEVGISSALFLFNLQSVTIEHLMENSESDAREIAASLGIHIEPNQRKPNFIQETRDARNKLRWQVNLFSLLTGTLHSLLNAKNINDVVKVMRQSVKILFNIDNCMFFNYHSTSQLLSGFRFDASNRLKLIDEFVLPWPDDSSIVSRCLTSGKLMFCFREDDSDVVSILDRQIMDLMNSDGIISLPIRVPERIIGSIVLGLSRTQWYRLRDRSDLMMLFARQLGLAISNIRFHEDLGSHLQDEKMAAFKYLARRLTHEIANPLGIIKNYLQVLKINLEKQGIKSEEISIIGEEMDRVATLASELDSFSSSSTIKPAKKQVDVNSLIKDLIKIIKEAIDVSSLIKIRLDLDPDLPLVTTNEASLKQVILNLVKNAIESMHREGILTLKTRVKNSAYWDGTTETPIQPTQSVSIYVTDTGPGISQKLRSHLFDPYVTTKGKEHSGLGLSIVYNIVKSLKGEISFETLKAGGTQFRVELQCPIH